MVRRRKNRWLMKRLLFIMTAVAMAAVVQGKKMKVTIDGTLSPGVEQMYLIINEDTANAQLLDIQDGKFSVTVKVDKNAFIRLQNPKYSPDRYAFVLIPDSRHITVDSNNDRIIGSDKSRDLQVVCQQIESNSPENTRIDVFSHDPRAWKEAKGTSNALKDGLREGQRMIVRDMLLDDKNNIILAWIAYRYPEVMEGELNELIGRLKPKWIDHPILKK